MQSAALPDNEEARTEKLDFYQVLDTPPEEAFDRITRIVSETIGVPIALVSLVDRDRQWFKSKCGLGADETQRDIAFCAHAILQNELFIVPDATKDDRFFDNPLVVSGPEIRFYAGAPLTTPDGLNLGTLCAIDTKPRKLTKKKKQLLADFAKVVVDELELRIALKNAVDLVEAEEKQRKLKDEFVSIISHELRTPLTSIGGSLGLIAGGAVGQLPSEMQDLIAIAHRNSQRLSHLINDFLDIEKLAAGQMHLDLQPQNLLPLVEQAMKDNETYGAERRVKLRMTDSEPGLEARVDATRLVQVLLNLISNAIKYSPEDGTVRVSLQADDSHVRVTVTDDGPGVPAEFHSRIFEKFAQADSSDTRMKGGTGLGLAISRELVERMGGGIGFESVEGEGASFFFELPIWNVEGPKSVKDPLGSAMIPALRVLVVEDDHDAAHLLGLLLTRAGYTVDIAHSGEQALKALHRGNYGAMTLDLALPDMSGLKVIQQVRQQAETADLPILVISGKAEDGKLLIKGEFANIDWLPKPIDEARLLAAVQNHLVTTSERNFRVLHVEDDNDLRQVVRTAIYERFDVESATTLAEARARLSQEHFDLVLLDIALPDGSGWGLLPEIRSRLPQAHVIILSGMDVTPEATRKVEAVLLKSRLSPMQLLEAMSTQVGLTKPEGTIQ